MLVNILLDFAWQDFQNSAIPVIGVLCLALLLILALYKLFYGNVAAAYSDQLAEETEAREAAMRKYRATWPDKYK